MGMVSDNVIYLCLSSNRLSERLYRGVCELEDKGILELFWSLNQSVWFIHLKQNFSNTFQKQLLVAMCEHKSDPNHYI